MGEQIQKTVKRKKKIDKAAPETALPYGPINYLLNNQSTKNFQTWKMNIYVEYEYTLNQHGENLVTKSSK